MIWNERIKELREKSHITLLDLSKRLGVSEATAQRYESDNGIKNIPYEQIIKIAEIFSVSPCYLMGWEESPSPSSANLTDEESDLLKNFRILNAAGRDKLLERSRELIGLGFVKGETLLEDSADVKTA